MLFIGKIGKKDKEEIFKKYFNNMNNTRLALIQMKMSSNKEKNLDKAISKIKIAKKKGANIVCLPELFLTNYFCQIEKHSNFNLAENIPGPTTEIFSLSIVWINLRSSLSKALPNLSSSNSFFSISSNLICVSGSFETKKAWYNNALAS